MKEDNLPMLSTPTEELENKLLAEDNIDNIKNIIDIFNVNIQKKNIIRTNKLNELQDKVYSQINERISTNADAFSNKDLLEYFKVIQDTINKTSIDSENITEPKIQLNQNNININMKPELDRNSRAKIADAIEKILGKNAINSEANIIEEQEGNND